MKQKLVTGIIHGKPENMEQFLENCRFFEGKKVDITVENHITKRSDPQNRFWRGVVLPLSEQFSLEDGTPHGMNEWHEYFIHKGFFGYKDMNGELVPKRSSEADTLEFNQAIDKAQKFWAQHNRVIPDPNQTDFLEEGRNKCDIF